jgi:hypothetical protein
LRSSDRHERAKSPKPSVWDIDLNAYKPILVPVSEAERKLLDPENTGRHFVRMQPRCPPPVPGSRQPYQGPERRRPVPMASTRRCSTSSTLSCSCWSKIVRPKITRVAKLHSTFPSPQTFTFEN